MSSPRHDEKKAALHTVINLCRQQRVDVCQRYQIGKSTLNNWLNRDDHVPFSTATVMNEEWGVWLERLTCSDQRPMTQKAVRYTVARQARSPMMHPVAVSSYPVFTTLPEAVTIGVEPLAGKPLVVDITGDVITGQHRLCQQQPSNALRMDTWRVDWQGFLMGYPVLDPLFSHLLISDKVYCGAWKALALSPFFSKPSGRVDVLPSALQVAFRFFSRYQQRLKERPLHQTVGFAHRHSFLKAVAVVSQGRPALVAAMDEGALSIESAYAQLEAPVTTHNLIAQGIAMAQQVFCPINDLACSHA